MSTALVWGLGARGIIQSGPATLTLAVAIIGLIAAVCAIFVAVTLPEPRDAMRDILSTIKCFIFAAINSNCWAACTH